MKSLPIAYKDIIWISTNGLESPLINDFVGLILVIAMKGKALDLPHSKTKAKEFYIEPLEDLQHKHNIYTKNMLKI